MVCHLYVCEHDRPLAFNTKGFSKTKLTFQESSNNFLSVFFPAFDADGSSAMFIS